MRNKQTLWVWALFIMGIVLTSMAGETPAATSPITPQATAASVGGLSPAPQDINQMQRVLARRHIPGLIVFLASVISLAILLRLKARDLELLRKQGFFSGPHPGDRSD